MNCNDFSNDFVDLNDVTIATDAPSDETTGVGLSGPMKLLQEIDDGLDVSNKC
jgi:hypothetical protein